MCVSLLVPKMFPSSSMAPQNCERFGKEYVIAMLKKDILEKSFQLEEDKSSPEAVPCSMPVQVPTISSLT